MPTASSKSVTINEMMNTSELRDPRHQFCQIERLSLINRLGNVGYDISIHATNKVWVCFSLFGMGHDRKEYDRVISKVEHIHET